MQNTSQRNAETPDALATSFASTTGLAIAGSSGAQAAKARERVLVVCRSYPPAKLAGGPTRSVSGLVQSLKAHYAVSVVTSAYEPRTTTLLDGVAGDRWIERDGARVLYLDHCYSPSVRFWGRLIRDVDPSLIYLNSFFDVDFTIKVRMGNAATRRSRPVLLAPSGEFSSEALQRKALRKYFTIKVLRWVGRSEELTWHASDPREEGQIRLQAREDERIIATARLRPDRDLLLVKAQEDSNVSPRIKRSIIFLGRVVPHKGLMELILAIRLLKEPAFLTITGPIEDEKYWAQCEEALCSPLSNLSGYRATGAIDPDLSLDALARNCVMALPSLSENYGHSYLEALAVGTPIVSGPETPWASVQSDSIQVYQSRTPAAIADCIEQLLVADETGRRKLSTNARRVALDHLRLNSGEDSIAMVRSVIGS